MSYKWVLVLVCAALVVGACSNAATQVSGTAQIPATGNDVLPPEVLQNIQNQISTLLGVPVESIQIQNVERKDWPDACLGLPQTGEQCAQALVPGWLLVFSINGQEYRYRTNQDGTILRLEP